MMTRDEFMVSIGRRLASIEAEAGVNHALDVTLAQLAELHDLAEHLSAEIAVALFTARVAGATDEQIGEAQIGRWRGKRWSEWRVARGVGGVT